MFFKGHSKSLRTSQSHADTAENQFIPNEKEQPHKRKQKLKKEFPGFSARTDACTDNKSVLKSSSKNDVTDDRGNKPSRSLWIGNTPSDLTDSQLEEGFARFGHVISARAMPKYSFVNFETVDAAVEAWSSCKNRELYEAGRLLHIRFTAPDLEVKQMKEPPLVRKSSTGIKNPITRQDSGGSLTHSAKSPTIRNSADLSVWPNGVPPTGPKNLRKDISPPPLRRGDTYRPFTDVSKHRPQHDIYRPEHRHRQSNHGEQDRRHDLYRPVSRSRSQSRSRSRSRSRSWSRNSSLSATDYNYNLPGREFEHEHNVHEDTIHGSQVGPDEFPQERNAEFNQRIQEDVRRAWEIAKKKDDALKFNVTSWDAFKQIDINNLEVECESVQESEGAYSPRSEICSHEHKDTYYKADGDSFNQSGLSTSLTLAKASPSTSSKPSRFSQSANSPSMQINKRLRLEKDETLSTVSELTTSSKSSRIKKKCTSCKKPGNDLSALIMCSNCPRQFHTGCCDSELSPLSEKSTFVCGRCARHGKVNPGTTSVVGDDGKSHLASPPLSHNNNDPAESAATLRRLALSINTYDNAVSSIILPNTPQTPATAGPELGTQNSPAMDQTCAGLVNGTGVTVIVNNEGKDAQRDATTLSAATERLVHLAKVNMDRYSKVTCAHWKSGRRCLWSEKACLFAHENTGIVPPDGRSKDKHWTCHEWLNGNQCRRLESECLYAHHDTGLYTWNNRRPSFKHITCYWWISRDRCRFSDDSCKYAHSDTGVYSHDPTEKRYNETPVSLTRPGSLSNPSKDYVITQESLTDRTVLLQTTSSALDGATDIIGFDMPTDQNLGSAIDLQPPPIQAKVSTVQSLDPRKQLRTTSVGRLRAVNKDGDEQIECNTPQASNLIRIESIEDQPTMENNDTIQSPTSSRTKRCKLCSKIVFNDVLCKKCKGVGTGLDLSLTSTVEEVIDDNVKASLEGNQNPAKDQTPDLSDVIMKDFAQVNSDTPNRDDLPRIPAKRLYSGDNMFIPNKRPKSSMLFSSSNRRHPSLLRRSSINVGLTGKVTPPTLDQLTQRARMENEKQNDLPAMDLHNNNRAPDSTYDDQDKEIQTAAVQENSPTLGIALTNLPDSTDRNTTGSVQPLQSREQSDTAQALLVTNSTESSVSSETDQDEDCTIPQANESPGQSQTTQSERENTDDEVQAVVESPIKQSPRRAQMTMDEINRKRSNLKPQLNLTTGLPLPYVCGGCRRHHKKCLHDETGAYDPEKCRQYVLGRKGVQDTGRSKSEWLIILNAAGPDDYESSVSDEELTEDAELENDSLPSSDIHYVSRSEKDEARHEDVEIRSAPPIIITSQKHLRVASDQSLPSLNSEWVASTFARSPLVRKTRHLENCDWTSEDEKVHKTKLMENGVKFEEDTSEDDDIGFMDHRSVSEQTLPSDPLWVGKNWSRDLYEVLPRLHPSCRDNLPSTRSKMHTSKKDQWQKYRVIRRQEQQYKFGNPFWEIDRAQSEPKISALVERVVPGREGELPSVQIVEEKITFREFLGAPRDPVACHMADQSLAYRDSGRDLDRGGQPRSVRILVKKVTDDDKFPVYDR